MIKDINLSTDNLDLIENSLWSSYHSLRNDIDKNKDTLIEIVLTINTLRKKRNRPSFQDTALFYVDSINKSS